VLLASSTAVPDRTDRVDDVPGGKSIAPRDLGIARRTAAQLTALGEKFGSSGAMDRAIDTASTQERRIGCVDDGVNAQGRNVGNDDFEARVAQPARHRT
jgi:hypothetical protein